MRKDFSRLSTSKRDAEAKKWERGISYDETHPMSKKSQALWSVAKRGRPRKPADEKSRKILISIEPRLLSLVEAFAASNELDKSKLFALSVQAFMAADHAHRQAYSAEERGAASLKSHAAH